MDFFSHAVAERLVDELMTLYAGFATKGVAYDHRFEMLSVADYLQKLASQIVCDIVLYIFGRNHDFLLGSWITGILNGLGVSMPQLIPGVQEAQAQSRQQQQGARDDGKADRGRDVSRSEKSIAKAVYHVEEWIQV
jgi:hypothetical protein